MPTVSPDGRTTFTVRPGYQFSLLDQPVTAETFRRSSERLRPGSPKTRRGHTSSATSRRGLPGRRGGTHLRTPGEGRHAVDHAGEAVADFLQRLALPPLPGADRHPVRRTGSPTGARGAQRSWSAGPYYVAEYSNEDYVILKRNPNYHGPRPQAFDAIAIREGVDASASVNRVQNEGWTDHQPFQPGARPGGPSGPALGLGSSRRRKATNGTSSPRDSGPVSIAFHPSRTCRRARSSGRALAIDRDALAAAWSAVSTDQLVFGHVRIPGAGSARSAVGIGQRSRGHHAGPHRDRRHGDPFGL